MAEAVNATTPIMPGVYGGSDPITVIVGEVSDAIGLLLGTIKAEVTIKKAGGDTWACVWVRARVV